jgi:hypothetical protein
MVRRKEVQYFWEAEAKLKILDTPGLAFAVQTVEKRSEIKREKFYEFNFSGWLNSDEKIIFDTGKRLRGWFKQQAKTIRPSLGEVLQYGVRCLSTPRPGAIEIGTIDELVGDKNEDISDDFKRAYRMPDSSKLPYPMHDAFTVGTGKDLRPVFSFYYAMPKGKELGVRITSFARNFTPEMAKWMLEKLGKVQGLGDKYTQGYGLFSLSEFKATTEEMPL